MHFSVFLVENNEIPPPPTLVSLKKEKVKQKPENGKFCCVVCHSVLAAHTSILCLCNQLILVTWSKIICRALVVFLKKRSCGASIPTTDYINRRSKSYFTNIGKIQVENSF